MEGIYVAIFVGILFISITEYINMKSISGIESAIIPNTDHIKLLKTSNDYYKKLIDEYLEKIHKYEGKIKELEMENFKLKAGYYKDI